MPVVCLYARLSAFQKPYNFIMMIIRNNNGRIKNTIRGACRNRLKMFCFFCLVIISINFHKLSFFSFGRARFSVDQQPIQYLMCASLNLGRIYFVSIRNGNGPLWRKYPQVWLVQMQSTTCDIAGQKYFWNIVHFKHQTIACNPNIYEARKKVGTAQGQSSTMIEDPTIRVVILIP